MSEPLREADAPQSHQDLVVGSILLLLAEQRGHGYELHERINQVMPLWDVSPGNLYRELRRMDADGLVASVWEASQTRGPARRVYEITNAGRRALDGWIMGVGGLVEMLEACIAMHASLPTPTPARLHRRRA
jgi:DNA-binding PadR family transcriptional regulator